MKFHQRARRIKGRQAAVLSAAVVTTTLVLAGCSGGSADAGSTSDAAQGGSASASSVTVDAMNPVTEFDGPTQAFQPPSDKHILLLYCGSAGQGCVNEANETKIAAESLGWTVDMVDGKLDPTVWNQVVKQAVDSGVDGIISISGDPNLMTDAMAGVQAKDIPFVLTSQVPTDADTPGVDTYIAVDPVSGGNDVADWIIADSGATANVLLLDLPGYYSAMTRTKTIGDDLARDCPNCVVTKADIAVQTMGTSLAPLVTAQLQQHPDVDYVWSPDDCCVSFVQQGIQQAGKASGIKVVSFGGFPDQLKNVQTGQVAAEQAVATLYQSWLSVDSLARLMAGQPAQKYWAVPERIWTAANIADAPAEMFTSGWNTDFDFRASFKQMWGVQQ